MVPALGGTVMVIGARPANLLFVMGQNLERPVHRCHGGRRTRCRLRYSLPSTSRCHARRTSANRAISYFAFSIFPDAFFQDDVEYEHTPTSYRGRDAMVKRRLLVATARTGHAPPPPDVGGDLDYPSVS